MIRPVWKMNKLNHIPISVIIAVQCIWATTGSIAYSAETPYDLANRAFYRAKTVNDYRKSAEQYRAILRSGEISAPLLNNLGNAWLKAGRFGAAIAAYERALRYAPGDARISANLDLAKNQITAAIPAQKTPALDVVFFWDRHLTAQAISWTGMALVAAAAALATLRLFNVRLPYSRTGIALFLFAAVLFFLSAIRLRAEHISECGVISVYQAQLYSNDSTDSQSALKRPLPEGTPLSVLARRGDWTRVSVPAQFGDAEGWMRNADILTYSERSADFSGD
jgi:tetratricopeptide (TPR) repeat protein